jgi:hypothetical protein
MSSTSPAAVDVPQKVKMRKATLHLRLSSLRTLDSYLRLLRSPEADCPPPSYDFYDASVIEGLPEDLQLEMLELAEETVNNLLELRKMEIERIRISNTAVTAAPPEEPPPPFAPIVTPAKCVTDSSGTRAWAVAEAALNSSTTTQENPKDNEDDLAMADPTSDPTESDRSSSSSSAPASRLPILKRARASNQQMKRFVGTRSMLVAAELLGRVDHDTTDEQCRFIAQQHAEITFIQATSIGNGSGTTLGMSRRILNSKNKKQKQVRILRAQDDAPAGMGKTLVKRTQN